jgi:hypothetical protein
MLTALTPLTPFGGWSRLYDGPVEVGDIEAVLDRFRAGLVPLVQPVALWAHGSLAMGDFQPGRSDLDLIAVVDEPLSETQTAELTRLHQELDRDEAAAMLHCSYMPRDQVSDHDVRHFTWAHREVLARPVTVVTHRELQQAGRVLHGAAPAAILPPVSDDELNAFIRTDLRDYWLPHTDLSAPWCRDIWVDLGMLTYARAVVTLREGRLTTKAQALDELVSLGAPAKVVADIRTRRYGEATEPGYLWRKRRGAQVRHYLGAGIRRVLADAGTAAA